MLTAGLAAAALLVAGCSAAPVASQSPGTASPPPTSAALTESSTLTVLTHDSFYLPDELLAAFETQSGLKVTYEAPGNAGTLVNQLILTKDSPLGDVVFGIDNTFATRAVDAGVLSPYASPALPADAGSWAADVGGALTPVDYGDVCVNADADWFAEHKLAVPETFEDLVKPEYADLLVVSNPASSSPGLAMVIATVGAKGDPGYLDYWKALKANGLKVVPGWTEAYTVEFSGSSGKGSRPLVLSYASSPASEVRDDGHPQTVNLPQTCLRQVEYAGVVAGAQNEAGAREFIDWLLSVDVQAQIPDNMWMYPVSDSVKLPESWAEFGAAAKTPWHVPASDIATKRDGWIKDWTAVVIG
jgi:thiamine transport system substrate-binding protein